MEIYNIKHLNRKYLKSINPAVSINSTLPPLFFFHLKKLEPEEQIKLSLQKEGNDKNHIENFFLNGKQER